VKTLSSNTLRRDPERIKKILTEKNNSLFTDNDITIHIPKRYVDVKLAKVQDTISSLLCAAIVLDDEVYSVINLLSMVIFLPDAVEEILVDDKEYYELHFNKGSTVIQNLKVVKNDEVIYPVINEFLINGNVPWFMEYEDLGINLFKTSKTHADSPVSNNLVGFEAMISTMARDPDDRTKEIRHLQKFTGKPIWIGLSNVYYAFKNTTNKLLGSYMKKGVRAALIHPAESVEKVEDLIRR